MPLPSPDAPHEFKFRGVNLPADVVERFIQGSISRTGLALLVIVESYVEHCRRGCFATNSHFAGVLKLSKARVAGEIQSLVKRGLLISYQAPLNGNPSHRFLETCWSRTKLEQAEIDQRGGTQRMSRGGTHSLSTGTPSYSKKEGGKGKSGRVHDRFAHPKSKTSSNGKGPRPEGKHAEAAQFLKDSLRKNKRPVSTTWDPRVQTEHLRLLEKSIGMDYLPFLRAYCKRCSFDDITEFGLPTVNSAKQFADRFDWIRQKCMKLKWVWEKKEYFEHRNDDGTSSTRSRTVFREE